MTAMSEETESTPQPLFVDVEMGEVGESSQTIDYTEPANDDDEEKPQTRKHHSDSISTELTTQSDGTPSTDSNEESKEEEEKPSCCSDQLFKMATSAD
jgi:hypothetical protein